MCHVTSKGRFRASLFIAIGMTNPLFASADTFAPVWVGNTGAWEDPTQWTPNGVPGNAGGDMFVPTINAGSTSISSLVTVSGLTLGSSGGLHISNGSVLTIDGQQASTLKGNIDVDPLAVLNVSNATFDGGNTFFSGAGTMHFTGTANVWKKGYLAWQGTSYVDPGASLNVGSNLAMAGRLFFNNGTLSMTGGQVNTGIFTNNGTLLFVPANNDVTFHPGLATDSTFTNHGLISVSVPAGGHGGMYFEVPFESDGAIEINLAPFSGNQPYINFKKSCKLSGTVNTASSSAGVNFVTGCVLNNALLTGAGNYAAYGEAFSIEGVNQASNIVLSNITGSGNLAVTKSMTVRSSTFFTDTFSTSGTVSIVPGATLLIPSAVVAVYPVLYNTGFTLTLDRARLENGGVATVAPFLDFFGTPTLGATLFLKNSATLSNSGTLVLNNSLTVSSDGSSGATFTNTGIISVVSGVFNWNVPGTFSGSVSFGNTSNTVTAVVNINAKVALAGATLGSGGTPNDAVRLPAGVHVTGENTVILGSLGGDPGLSSAVVEGPRKLSMKGASWFSGAIAGRVDLLGGVGISRTGGTGESPTNSPNFLIATQGPKIIDGVPLTVAADCVVDWISWRVQQYPGTSVAGHEIDLKNGGTIVNHGTFYIYDFGLTVNTVVNVDGNPAAGLFNHGTFGRHAYTLSGSFPPNKSLIAVPVYNDGFIDIQQANMEFAKGFQDTGSLSQPSTFNVAANATLSFTGGVVSIVSAMHNVSGTVMFNAPSQSVRTVDGAGIMYVGASLVSDGIRANRLVIGGGAVHTIRPNGAATGTSKVGTLVLSTDGAGAFNSTLDLADNGFILQSDPAVVGDKAGKLALLRTAVIAGKQQGDWQGKGITSSAAALDPIHKAVFIVDNALLYLSQFGGETVNSDSLLVEATWYGDTNLDRRVDVGDLGVLATYYGSATGAGILAGDFNQDGRVDVTDLGLLATNYGVGTNGNFSGLGSDAFSIGLVPLVTSVPEPNTLVVFGLSLVCLQRGRRLGRGNIIWKDRMAVGE